MPFTHQRRSTDNDIIVGEIDEFVKKNSLSEIERLLLRVMKHNYIDGLVTRQHVQDKECHTPKGILVRGQVIGWFLFLMVLVSTIVMYFPEALALLKLP